MSINPFSRGTRAGKSSTRLENGSRVKEIFFRTLHPSFLSRYIWNLAASLVDGSPESIAI
jgi:hypothetical protein